MTGRRTVGAASPSSVAVVVLIAAAACGGSADAGPAEGADVDRPAVASMDSVAFVDVAADVGVDFRHGAFQWDTTGDPNAMMGGGVCWIDADDDGWLDLFVVNTWSNGEWGRWRERGALPSTRLFRNDRGRFTDATDEMGVGLEVRGNGCVAADLDRDGHTDLYVTTERENVLLWNADGDRFEVDDGSAGVDAQGWQAGAAVGDVNGDGWPDLFVAGYADLNGPISGASKGFPNTYVAEPDLLFVNQGTDGERRPTFVDRAPEVGIEPTQIDYGLGALMSDVDLDGDLDLYVANDTHPNRLYLNEPADNAVGVRFVEAGAAAGVDDDNAGMGLASGDYDGDQRPDLVVTNLDEQGHAVFRAVGASSPPVFRFALEEMGLPDLGQGLTGWGTSWNDLDLDGDLDLALAHGDIPVTDLDADREPLQVFENLTSAGRRGEFTDATTAVGLVDSGRHLGRGLAAADYDNDGDMDLALATIGGDLALLRNQGAGGHWVVIAPDPALPGTIVSLTAADGSEQRRELNAGGSYLSSEDPRAHFGLGESMAPVMVSVVWPDGSRVSGVEIEPDRTVAIRPD